MILNITDGSEGSGNPKYKSEFWISKQCASRKISDIMTRVIIAVPLNTSIDDTLELIKKHRFHNIPVVDKNNMIKGVIDQNIIMELIFHDRLPSSSHTHLTAIRSLGESAETIMIPHPLTIAHDTNLCEAVDMMLKHNINHAWVLDENDKLIGVVTKHDIIDEAYRTRGKD